MNTFKLPAFLPRLALREARAAAYPFKAVVRSAFRGIFLLSLGAVTLLFPSIGHAETWTFDPTFQRTPLRVTSESATGVRVLSSGKVLIHSINAFLMSGANGQRIGALVRIDPTTGAIDPTWSSDPTLGFSFLGVAEAPDGKIYYSCPLTGDLVYNATDPAVNRLIRLNTDGSRDTSFNSPIFAAISRFVTVQPDGKIIVCSGGVNRSGVPPPGAILQTVRLNTDGTLDTSFQSPNFQNTATSPPANDVGVFGNPVIDSATGKIYFCGTFRFVNGQPRKAIVRCNADGTVDSSFVPTGLIGGNTQLIGRAIVLQAGGKVVLGGFVLQTAAGGATRYALLRFNADGTLDPAFTLFPTTNSSGVALVPGYTGPRHISVLPGGNILTSDTRVLRFLPDGTLDSSFTPLDYSSPFFTPNGGSIAAFRFDVDQNTGAAYLASAGGPLYTRLNGVPVGNIMKLTPGGTIDTQFNSPVVEAENFDPDVQIAASGAVYVSGYHTDFGNTANATITRLLANGTRDATYAMGALPFADKQAVQFALLPDSSAYVVFYSGSFNGGYSFSNLARLLPTGAIDTSFRLSSALQTAISINAFDGNDRNLTSLPQISSAPSGKLYVFNSNNPQATVNGNGNQNLTRINTDGTEDTSVPALGFPVGEVTRDGFGMITGGSTGYLRRLGQTADGGLIVLASIAPFPTSTGLPYNYRVIKLLADGSRDPNFGSPSLTSTVSPFVDFPVITDPLNGTTYQPGNGFYRAGAFPVSSASMLPDGSVLLVGNFRLTGGATDYLLAKLTAAGTFDTSFNPPVPQNLARPTRPPLIFNVRVAPDGKVWVLGRFDTIGGLSAPGVARMNLNGAVENSFSLTQVGYDDSFGNADVVFVDRFTAYLVGTFRRPGEPLPFAVTRIATAPVITSPLAAAGTVGVPFTYQFLALGATSLSVTSLPPGLTFNTTLSAIVGTPTVPGLFSVGLNAINGAGTTTATLNLTIQPTPAGGPTINSSSAVTGRPGQPFRFQVTTTGGSPAARISATGLPAGLTIDVVTGVISGTTTFEGSAAVTLTVTDGAFTTSAVLQLTFTADPALPVITSPDSAALTPGVFFSYTITAPTSVGPSDPTIFTLIGTLPAGLTFDATTGTISGFYTGPLGTDLAGGTLLGQIQLFATNSQGTSSFQLSFRAPPIGAVNIATRTTVGAGENVLIGGFIVSGTVPKIVIVRAIGPSLNPFLAGALQDPTLELNRAGQPNIFNDNWRDNPVQEPIIIGSGLAPTDNRESAIVVALDPGNYTAIVRGNGAATGIAVVEVYDLGTASAIGNSGAAKLGNIATRGFVNTGDNVMIGGFIIQRAPTRVVVRAIGPSLLNFGVSGALTDPTRELKDANGVTLVGNDDWQQGQPVELQQAGLAPSDPRESAVITVLPSGQFTAVVSGKGGATGVALVEVYALE